MINLYNIKIIIKTRVINIMKMKVKKLIINFIYTFNNLLKYLVNYIYKNNIN